MSKNIVSAFAAYISFMTTTQYPELNKVKMIEQVGECLPSGKES